MYPTLLSCHLCLDDLNNQMYEDFLVILFSLALGWGNEIDLITLQLVIVS